jgi:hypothetical protein
VQERQRRAGRQDTAAERLPLPETQGRESLTVCIAHSCMLAMSETRSPRALTRRMLAAADGERMV